MLSNCHKTYGYLFLLIFFMAMSGCASINNNKIIAPPLALNANPDYTGLGNQLVLMTLKIKNNTELKFNPTLQLINVRSGKMMGLYQYALGAPCRIVNDNKIYLLSFSLPTGNYELTVVTGYSDFNNVKTQFTIPLHVHFSVGPSGIVYLGSMNVVLQQNNNVTSLWVGSMSTLVNQNKDDFSNGNFSFEIDDNYAEDLTDFSSAYPALIDQDVEKSILDNQQQQFVEE